MSFLDTCHDLSAAPHGHTLLSTGRFCLRHRLASHPPPLPGGGVEFVEGAGAVASVACVGQAQHLAVAPGGELQRGQSATSVLAFVQDQAVAPKRRTATRAERNKCAGLRPVPGSVARRRTAVGSWSGSSSCQKTCLRESNPSIPQTPSGVKYFFRSPSTCHLSMTCQALCAHSCLHPGGVYGATRGITFHLA
jgi:hypothetical protein